MVTLLLNDMVFLNRKHSACPVGPLRDGRHSYCPGGANSVADTDILTGEHEAVDVYSQLQVNQ